MIKVSKSTLATTTTLTRKSPHAKNTLKTNDGQSIESEYKQSKSRDGTVHIATATTRFIHEWEG